jgi:kinesin family protein 2/24
MNRVKSLSKSGNARKDQAVSSLPPTNKDASSTSSLPVSVDVDDVYEQQEVRVPDMGRRVVEKETPSYNPTVDYDKQPSSFPSGFSLNEREENGLSSGIADRERFESNSSYGGLASQKVNSSYTQHSADTEEKVPKVSPPRRKISREEKSEKFGNWLKKDGSGSDLPTAIPKPQNTGNYSASNTGSRQYKPDPPVGNINAILEVGSIFGIYTNFVVSI